MKSRIVKKIFVWGISIILVCGFVTGVILGKNKISQTAQETQYEELKVAMSEEEIESLYDVYKKERQESFLSEIPESVENNEQSDSDITGKEEDEMTVKNEADKAAQEISYSGCPVDFEGMWKINEDVYAWITIPGTNIDYPILQHPTDNTYYLNYNIDGSYGYPGCIYTENLNSKDFTDNNTVIYGHNMKAGTMFADLHKYEDSVFFYEHSKVYIYTPSEELSYTIFAAYIYDDRHLLYSFDFTDKTVYSNYLEDILNMRSLNANIREDIRLTADNKIITLATCVGNQPEKRMLVQAVLNVDEE